MNEDIIRMAREAGMGGMLTDVVCTHAELERFAELVRADEREACAKLIDTTDLSGLKSDLWLQNYTALMLSGYSKTIRARGNK
jgi:hypothetical protein